jgi:hypothetical protein
MFPVLITWLKHSLLPHKKLGGIYWALKLFSLESIYLSICLLCNSVVKQGENLYKQLLDPFCRSDIIFVR